MRPDIANTADEPQPQGEKPGAWMVTFTDLVCLMLTFFVMLFAVSVPEEDVWETVVSALTMTDDVTEEVIPPRPDADRNVVVLDIPQAANLDYLMSLFNQKLAEDPALAQLTIRRVRDGMVVSLPSDLLFQSGSADLTDEGKALTQPLAQLLGNLENQIRLYGHADPTPLRTGTYASNWELSLARAFTVARLLRANGYREDMIVNGLADSRFAELPASLSEQERMRLARRVDVLISPEASELSDVSDL